MTALKETTPQVDLVNDSLVNELVADICLIVEGAYPYIAGGVSSWIDQLIRSQSHLSFHVVAIVPELEGLKPRYTLPSNVLSLEHVLLHGDSDSGKQRKDWVSLCQSLEEPLLALQEGNAGPVDLERVAQVLNDGQGIDVSALLNSRAAWDLTMRMYQRIMPNGSFSHYLWSVRSFLRSLFASLTAPVPAAHLYHTITTGYAGLFSARAHMATGRPVLLTEHGIYTNERRIELTLAEWLPGGGAGVIGADAWVAPDLRDIWINIFVAYARVCYGVASKIVTLYEGNQRLQMRDGADPEKMLVIPNGMDPLRFAKLDHTRHDDARPTIALIGRVVPIKDVKTFVRAVDQLRGEFVNLRAWVLGPTNEDPLYFQECKSLAQRLGCAETVEFLGQVPLEKFLGMIDVVVLTSLSEAQPLVVLEAGSAGVPMVATDVGACREMIAGVADDDRPGGAITELASPSATAEAVAVMLRDPDWRKQCGAALKERIRRRYDKALVDRTYADLYAQLISADTVSSQPSGKAA